jgi:hypothetical protein
MRKLAVAQNDRVGIFLVFLPYFFLKYRDHARLQITREMATSNQGKQMSLDIPNKKIEYKSTNELVKFIIHIN